MNNYPIAFKETMVKKLTGARAKSATALAEEVGVSQSTLSRWVREYGRLGLGGIMSDKRAGQWSGEERMAAIIEYEKLSEEERGRFLRQKGLHEVEIAGWKQDFLEAFSAEGKRTRRSDPQQKRIRELEKELRRKEKALAEAAALLVLKKKAQAIWGDREDEE